MGAIAVQNRQRRVRLALPWIRRFAQQVLPVCAAAESAAALALPTEVEVAIVSDAIIARVHRDFMHLPDPTDVITFQHGEIVISAETAQARAEELGHSTEAELALYIVHGLLHLKGFEDASRPEAARMRKLQHRIWQGALRRLPFPY